MESWRREFYHFGRSKLDGAKVGSGRYPLGSGENPRAGKKAVFSLFGRGKQKETIKSIDKDARSNYDDDAWAQRKARAIKTGDVKFVNRYIDEFEPNEITNTNSNYTGRKNLRNNVAELEKKKYSNIMKWMEKTTATLKKVNEFSSEISKGAEFIGKVTGVKLPKFDMDESSGSGKKNKKKDKGKNNNQNQNQNNNQNQNQNQNNNQNQNRNQNQNNGGNNKSKDSNSYNMFSDAGISMLTPEEYYNKKLMDAITTATSRGPSDWKNYDYDKFHPYTLKHHGIDGQKWGVRNGPPYPLSYEKHAKVVREDYKKKS